MVILRDTEVKGLWLRITPQATRSWYVSYRVRPLPGQRREAPRHIRLGSHPAMTIEEAREEAQQHKAAAGHRVDLGRERIAADKAKAEEERRLAAGRETFREAALIYLQRLAEGKNRKKPCSKSHWISEHYALQKAIAAFGDKPVAEVHGYNDVLQAANALMPPPELDADIKKRIERLTAAPGGDAAGNPKPTKRLKRGALAPDGKKPKAMKGVAYHLFFASSRVFKCAMAREKINVNPCDRVLPLDRPKLPPPRTRYLSVADLAKLWRVADACGSGYLVFQFLIAVPMRATETSLLRWHDVRGDEQTHPCPRGGHQDRRPDVGADHAGGGAHSRRGARRGRRLPTAR